MLQIIRSVVHKLIDYSGIYAITKAIRIKSWFKMNDIIFSKCSKFRS